LLPKEIATQYETALKKIWDSAEFKEFMNRRGFDMIYLDSAGFAKFMKADNEDNGKALKSLGLCCDYFFSVAASPMRAPMMPIASVAHVRKFSERSFCSLRTAERWAANVSSSK
jgi:hypothetical protein